MAVVRNIFEGATSLVRAMFDLAEHHHPAPCAFLRRDSFINLGGRTKHPHWFTAPDVSE
jgi:hypothetical protein